MPLQYLQVTFLVSLCPRWYIWSSINYPTAFIGTRVATRIVDESIEGLKEKSEDITREVSVKLNELNAKVLELQVVQAVIRRLL